MGLITHSKRRSVIMCKTTSFRGYIFQKIKFDYEFRLQGHLSQITNSEIDSACK